MSRLHWDVGIIWAALPETSEGDGARRAFSRVLETLIARNVTDAEIVAVVRAGTGVDAGRALPMTERAHCKKGHRKRAPHPCPYKSDVNDDTRTPCTCCKACQAECAAEV